MRHIFFILLLTVISCAPNKDSKTGLFPKIEETTAEWLQRAVLNSTVSVQIDPQLTPVAVTRSVYCSPCIQMNKPLINATASTADHEFENYVINSCPKIPGPLYKAYVWHYEERLDTKGLNHVRGWINVPALLKRKKYDATEQIKGSVKEICLDPNGPKERIFVEN